MKTYKAGVIEKTILLLNIIWYLKALSTKIKIIVTNLKSFNWPIEVWNCLNLIYNDLVISIGIILLYILIDKFFN